jgi:hypothetical protein
MKTLGPNFRRRVRAATAAIVVMGSGTGSGDDSRSENQRESISVRSHRSTIFHRRSGPSSLAGHTPGITPTRYLICMRRTLSRVDLLSGSPVE